MIHGETWRCCVHPQFLVTKDGIRYAKTVYSDSDWPFNEGDVVKAGGRVNNRSGGNINGNSSGGGPTHPLTLGLDSNFPAVQHIYNGHYPNGNWNSGKTRYDLDPTEGNHFVHEGTGLEDTPLFDGNNGPRDSLPPWSFEQRTGNVGDPASNNDVYDGYWNMEFEGHDTLDYLVTFSTPSWNNRHGGAYKVGWVGLHQLDGSISKAENNAVKWDVNDWQEAPGGGAPGAHDSSFHNTSAVINLTPGVDPGSAEVLWTNGGYGFGRAQTSSIAVGGEPGIEGQNNSDPEAQGEVVSVKAGESFTLLGGGFTGSPLTLQWYFNAAADDPDEGFVAMPGSVQRVDEFGSPEFNGRNAPIYDATGAMAWNQSSDEFTEMISRDDHAGLYKLMAWNALGNSETPSIEVQVEPDPDPPTIVATSSLDGFQVTVEFNKVLDLLTAEDLANWSIDQDGSGSVDFATLQSDLMTVVLDVSIDDIAPGATYTVSAVGVQNLSGVGSDDSADGGIQGLFSEGIGNVNEFSVSSTSVGQMTVFTDGADIWASADNFTLVAGEKTGDFDVSICVNWISGRDPNFRDSEGRAHNNGGSRNGIMARESPNPDSRHM